MAMHHQRASKPLTWALCGGLLALASAGWANSRCLPPLSAHMPDQPDLRIANTGYSVGFCYLPERKARGVVAPYHRDLIVLKKQGAALVEIPTKMSITVGRIDELFLEKSTDRFIAVSYGAGEFCNGIVIFDLSRRKVATHLGCATPSDRCHVTELNTVACTATIKCEDMGAEGEPPTRQEPLIKQLRLCR